MSEVVKRKSALIVKLGQIGDVIMAIPAVHGLYEQGYEIEWVCGRAALPLLECYSWINAIPADDKAIFFGGISERVKGITSLWSRLIHRQYDLCATLYYDQRYRLLTLPVRSRRKLIFSRNSRQTSLLAGRHHTDEYARFLLGTEDSCREKSLFPVRPDRLPALTWNRRQNSKRIALVPGGVNHLIREQATGRLPEQALRRWPLENYVALAQQFIGRGWEIVLLGGAEDSWIKPHFGSMSFIDCLGTLSLPQVVRACDDCDAVITHDTGPLHLAGLSETSVIGIFGPTDPSTRVPRKSSVVGIWGGQGFACRPCYDGRDFAPCTFNGCMYQVTPELVLRELDQLLEERARGMSTPWKIVSPQGTAIPTSSDLVNLQ